MSTVNYELVGDIGVIRLNNPPVNALSHGLREGIWGAIKNAQGDASKALILLCEGRTFIAGADITEFGKPPQAPALSEVISEIENSRKPVVAAIHGTALGGGFEVALACHYRCALSSAKVGLPEVKLGLLPGAGGTQRAPRLAGVAAALELITKGTPIPAAKAESMKLIDRVISDDLLKGALAFANELIERNAPTCRVRDITIDPASIPEGLFSDFRQKLEKRTHGQLAPQHIVTCVEAAVQLPFEEGLAKELDLFIECLLSSQSAALRHIFFAERSAKKIYGLPKDTPTREINSVAIIGAGTMGGGIAMNFANAGIPVKLVEINQNALDRGLAIIDKNYNISLKKGKLTEDQKTHCLSLIEGTTHYADLTKVDLVIEAVFENMALKQEIFAKLDKTCKPGAILATNTSYQDIDQIAAATSRPEDVIGLHFFSPANVMKLLEVVRGSKSADDVIATAMMLAKTIKKTPVLAGNGYGFIGNRMLVPYAREAQLCLIEGATPEQIDTVMQSWGMAMGPMAMGDLAGLDIGYKVRQNLADSEKGDPKTYCIADALVSMGRLGQKSGAGYYHYDPETRARSNDPQVLTVIETHAEEQGVERREISDTEILNRLTFALINEGAKILEDGIAQRPSDIDVVYVYGYGFPPHRGGPMHYADSIGLAKVYDAICAFRDQHGEHYWTPAPLLTQLAQEGKTFANWAHNQR
ncbi:3-hydroxyacyl-CoA dehydrogenase NAD-binding domain-containing protein [Microbulbifer sp. OS29]|uniref:3-hydroxyacyl-CoA dehydrogenase NAD-binding domain-containing protein n=1 Tax=Microbulbifer okhotskensis TaxID=2926617 RepID=A0A9X2J5X4_9GAMM|nr:3-hydroxyacyl-CoA dehydrogenase NAD-binding domain-containing protein [Microbulbifer okhotskensis]MCO1335653.1 3-hydroxyacyl-CoA dehydrogenase NAD-binding domain-containing protein [Microbulbifer okhotskensis]